MSKESKNSGGMKFLDVLQIIFLVLKFAGLVNWSWWIVLMPSIISIVLFVLIFITFMVGLIIEEKYK